MLLAFSKGTSALERALCFLAIGSRGVIGPVVFPPSQAGLSILACPARADLLIAIF